MGLYLYPGLDTTPSRTRLQYLFLKINDESSCPYCVPCSNRPFPYVDPHHHAFPNATAFACGTMPLPNDDAFPTAEYLYRTLQRKPLSRMATRSRPQSIFAECFRESLLAEWHPSTKSGPNVSLFLVLIFGVNTHLLLPRYSL